MESREREWGRGAEAVCKPLTPPKELLEEEGRYSLGQK